MKKSNITLHVLAIGVLLITTISGKAQNQNEEKKGAFSVEIDPATFAFGGYSLHLRYQLKNSNKILVGVGAYAMDMPDVLVNMNSNNKDLGGKVRLNQGYGLFGEYYFSEVNSKWFIGTQLGLQEFKIENETEAGSAKYSNFLAMGYGGFTWKPLKNNLYLKPWAGVGYAPIISGDSEVGDLTYDVSPISYFVTLHMGYTF